MSQSPPNAPFRMESLLIKNLSLEIPDNVVAPRFAEKPEVQLEMRNKTRPLSQEHYHEVTLEGTARVKSGENLQLLIEAQHAGIFFIGEDDADKRQMLLGVHAPTMMYPYLSRLIGDLMAQAGCPRVFLPPFNFAVVYAKKQELLRQKMQEKDADDGARA